MLKHGDVIEFHFFKMVISINIAEINPAMKSFVQTRIHFLLSLVIF
jgi:hypothetical protein